MGAKKKSSDQRKKPKKYDTGVPFNIGYDESSMPIGGKRKQPSNSNPFSANFPLED